jgi:hypothetical protein
MFQTKVVEKIKMFQTKVVEKIKMFQTKVVEKIKTDILCSIIYFRKSCRL